MDKKVFDKFMKYVSENDTPETREMKDIFARMIESEVAWAKEHKDKKVCSRCGRKNQ